MSTPPSELPTGRRRGRRARRKLRFQKPGSPPGLLQTDPEAPPPRIRVLAYGPDGCDSPNVDKLDALPALLQRWPVVWIDVDGLGDAHVVGALGQLFGLHDLALEDVISVQQRPKLEHYESHDFIVARMVTHGTCVETEQLSLFLGKNFVITFQEGVPGDCFEPVRERIRKAGGKIRRAGA